jgi:hypothetical protein
VCRGRARRRHDGITTCRRSGRHERQHDKDETIHDDSPKMDTRSRRVATNVPAERRGRVHWSGHRALHVAESLRSRRRDRRHAGTLCVHGELRISCDLGVMLRNVGSPGRFTNRLHAQDERTQAVRIR